MERQYNANASGRQQRQGWLSLDESSSASAQGRLSPLEKTVARLNRAMQGFEQHALERGIQEICQDRAQRE